MGELLLRTRYLGERKEGSDPGRAADFLWGAFKIPEPLMLGGDVRTLLMEQLVEQDQLRRRLIYMQADVSATLKLNRFVASGTLGYADEGALGAALTRANSHNLVSRLHWLGYWLDSSETALLRAGRLNLPYGIRTFEHTLWVRSTTRTTINDDQQYGLSFAYSGEFLRSELMLVLGNLQVRPDEFRERGYSAYAEWLPIPSLGLGASSLITHRELDPHLLKEAWHHSHGVFARWATPWNPLVLLSEWDYVLDSTKQQARRDGFVGYAQADVEVEQGVHLLVTGEAQNVGRKGTPASWGAWLSYAWFFAPHADIRLDGVYQSFGSTAGRSDALSFLIQGHIYL